MSPRAATRRTTLLGALAAGPLLIACDGPTVDRPGPDVEEDPDAALVDEVRAEVAALLGLVSAAVRSDRRLREPLSGLLSMHAAHLAAIEGNEGDEGDGADEDDTVEPPAGGPAAVRARVTARERAHQGRLADAAVRARSGALARLLASMSAGVAAHLAAGAA